MEGRTLRFRDQYCIVSLTTNLPMKASFHTFTHPRKTPGSGTEFQSIYALGTEVSIGYFDISAVCPNNMNL